MSTWPASVTILSFYFKIVSVPSTVIPQGKYWNHSPGLKKKKQKKNTLANLDQNKDQPNYHAKKHFN